LVGVNTANNSSYWTAIVGVAINSTFENGWTGHWVKHKVEIPGDAAFLSSHAGDLVKIKAIEKYGPTEVEHVWVISLEQKVVRK